MFASIKKNRKSEEEEKPSSPKNVRKENLQFIEEHIEEFRFFVKYYPVFQSIAIAVGEEKIAQLDAEKPCMFRSRCETPFRCKCEICANDGTEIKTIKMCRECKASKKE